MNAIRGSALARALGKSGAVRAAVARRLHLDTAVDFWLGELGATWSPRGMRARVVEVIDETHDVKTFALEAGAGYPSHRAGQHTAVEVEVAGVRMRRCYSIASAPSERRLRITVKRHPEGRVSQWMHAHVRPGDVLGLGAPAGDFVLPDVTPSKVLLLSGGSGVTPLMSMLRDLAARDALEDVVFAHCARSADDVIFRRELDSLTQRHRGLRLALHLGAPLDAAALYAMAPDLASREMFVCGPDGMMRVAESVAASAGVSHRLRRERFAAPPIAAATHDGARVHLALSRRDVRADGAGTLLEQLERAGEQPDYGCRMGICNTCRCRKRSGTVVDLVTGATSSEADEDIRLCVSVARSDLELSL